MFAYSVAPWHQVMKGAKEMISAEERQKILQPWRLLDVDGLLRTCRLRARTFDIERVLGPSRMVKPVAFSCRA